MKTYAIGDIHGCNRTFQELLKQLDLQIGDELILLGDLIDRGPDSRGVVNTVWRLQDAGVAVVCLRGNHEQMLLDAKTHPSKLDYWLKNGGQQTLESFQIKYLSDLPGAYLDFFAAMPCWHETGDFLCVHGGLDFSKTDPLKHPETLLWMRDWYGRINYDWLGARTILHGHTPLELLDILLQHSALREQRYLNLDNGCVYAYRRTHRKQLGKLMAFALDTRELIWQDYTA